MTDHPTRHRSWEPEVNQEDFAITREGIKLSYVRFLSDSAGGYTLALLILIAFITDAPIPFSSLSWRDLAPGTINTEFVVLFGGLTLLLGTPIGLVMNATSWFISGKLQVYFVDFWLQPMRGFNWLVDGTKKVYNIHLLQEHFNLNHVVDKNGNRYNLYEQAAVVEEVLQLFYPQVWGSLSHIQGVKEYSRNLALIAGVVALYGLLTSTWTLVLLALVLFLLFTCLTSLIEFYLALGTMYKVYLLCYDELKKAPPAERQSIEDILELLYNTRDRLPAPGR